MNFDEIRKQAKAEADDNKSYEQIVQKAKDLLVKLYRTVVNEEGEKYSKVKVTVNIDDDDNNKSIRFTANEHEVLVLYYNPSCIDIAPESDDDPVELTDQDAKDLTKVAEHIAKLAKEKKNSKSEPSFKEWMSDIISGVKDPQLREILEKVLDNQIEDENEYFGIIAKILNTVNILDGPKYHKLSRHTYKGTTIFHDENGSVLIVSKKPSGLYSVGTDITKGPGALKTASPKLREAIDQLLSKVEGKIPNEFKDDAAFKSIEALLSLLPSQMRHQVLENVLKKF